MNPFGLLFIVVGALGVRQVAVGRAVSIPGDMRDLAVAFLSADMGDVTEVMSRRGQNVETDPVAGEVATNALVGGVAGSVSAADLPAGNGKVAQNAIRLGNAASGYRLGTTGPTYYDCSGLIWKAAVAAGCYSGGRFTTSTFENIAGSWCKKVSSPVIGDIILWPTHHMGVLIGTDKMYSARSPSKGIGMSTVSGDSDYFGSKPQYWRVFSG